MRSWLREGDTYVDVGAHIGFYVSIALEAVGARGRVVAFEPVPETLTRLCAAVEESGDTRVELHDAALGARVGEGTIFVPATAWANQASRASLTPDPAGRLEAADRVKVTTLDAVLPKDQCRLVKIDVEGGELDVIQGAEHLLAEQRIDAVLIELNPEALSRAGTTPEAVVAALGEHNYVGYALDEDGLAPLQVAELRAEFANAVFFPH
jgi:FkbM family methyltransferase